MDDARFNFREQVRRRILPGLAALDGIAERVPHILDVHDALTGQDLAFDLRRGPTFSSNLCAENAALEIGATFGRDRTGVRYQFEPTCKKGMLKNRYTLFRDRLSSTMRQLDASYDEELLRRLWGAFIGGGVRFARGDDATATILAVHHYASRLPRLKAYFGCDYVDEPGHGFEVTKNALAALDGGRVLTAQIDELRRAFVGGAVPRMVGFDFDPGAAVHVKMYVASEGLDVAGLASLLALSGGDRAAHDAVMAFLRIFLDDDAGALSQLNLVCLALDAAGSPRLKLYLRPVEHMDDGETLRRLTPWFAALGREHELVHVRAALSVVCPLEVLDETRGMFNYVSVDVTEAGVDKTSVYFVPQIPLAHLARHAPDRLPALDDDTAR
jgi:hypothetical protein